MLKKKNRTAIEEVSAGFVSTMRDVMEQQKLLFENLSSLHPATKQGSVNSDSPNEVKQLSVSEERANQEVNKYLHSEEESFIPEKLVLSPVELQNTSEQLTGEVEFHVQKNISALEKADHYFSESELCHLVDEQLFSNRHDSPNEFKQLSVSVSEERTTLEVNKYLPSEEEFFISEKLVLAPVELQNSSEQLTEEVEFHVQVNILSLKKLTTTPSVKVNSVTL